MWTRRCPAPAVPTSAASPATWATRLASAATSPCCAAPGSAPTTSAPRGAWTTSLPAWTSPEPGMGRAWLPPYDVSAARSLDDLASGLDQPGAELAMVPLEDAAAAAFPSRPLPEPEARSLSHGVRRPAAGLGPGPVAAFGPDGALVALLTEEDGTARSLVVFVP